MSKIDVPDLGGLDVQFAFGLNHAVRDHVIGMDHGSQVLCCVGSRLALVGADPAKHERKSSDDAPEPMRFLAHSRHVHKVTAVASDRARHMLAVCVVVDPRHVDNHTHGSGGDAANNHHLAPPALP